MELKIEDIFDNITPEQLSKVMNTLNQLPFDQEDRLSFKEMPFDAANPNVDLDIVIGIYHTDGLQFNNLTTEIRNANEEAKNKMQGFECKDIKMLQGLDKENYLIEIVNLYRATCFFPSKETLAFFAGVGIGEEHLVWFYDIDDVKKEFENIIKRKNIIFLEGSALMSLRSHLHMRILHEIFIWAGEFTENNNGKKFENRNHRIARRKLTDTKKIYDEDEIDDAFRKQLEMTDKLFTKRMNQRNILANIEGNNALVVFTQLITACKIFSKFNVKNPSSFFFEFYDLLYPVIRTGINGHAKGYILKSKSEIEIMKAEAINEHNRNKKKEFDIKKFEQKIRNYKGGRIAKIFGSYVKELEAQMSGIGNK